ncbi:MAG TPA: LIC12162 family protein, partial [Leptospiraceae bacterium]|nr:LIC12162 family protein [Leptospiraceae bacterium]
MPVVFLGEWCRLFKRKEAWSELDAIVCPPYGVSKARKDHDFEAASGLERELIPVLAQGLNRAHGLHHSERFWRILAGHWLKRFVDTIYNRYHTLEQCTSDVSGMRVLWDEQYSLAVVNSNSFVWASNDAVWNNVLFARLLPYLGSFQIERVLCDLGSGFRMKEVHPAHALPATALSRLKARLRNILRWLRAKRFSNRDALILHTYMSAEAEFDLQRKIGQRPRTWHVPPHAALAPVDRNLRESLRSDASVADPLRRSLHDLLFDLLPVCFLEGFSDLRHQASMLPWPRHPRFIFNCANYDTDEAFKCWTAMRVEEGIKYFIGQHGNNYGTHRQIARRTTEQMTADKFLTWGWTDGHPAKVPAFMFRHGGAAKVTMDPHGGLLLAEDCLPHHVYCWDIFHDYDRLFSAQLSFARALPLALKAKLTVRLHGPGENLERWGDRERWRDFDPEIELEGGAAPFGELLRRSRLVVYGYDSTGMLENLASNVPTMAFWADGLEHVLDTA